MHAARRILVLVRVRGVRQKVEDKQRAARDEPLRQPRRRQRRVLKVVEAEADARGVEAVEEGAVEAWRRRRAEEVSKVRLAFLFRYIL